LAAEDSFPLTSFPSIESGILAMLSTRQWLRLVVLTALNMLLFRGIWWILKYPPVALVVVIINLGLAFTWVRPRSLNRGVLAAMGAGLGVVVGSLRYLADAKFRALIAGAVLQALPDPLYSALPQALRTASGIQLLDFAIVDAIGIAAMLVAGWLAWPRRPARPISSAS
jgi:hypothetical protein